MSDVAFDVVIVGGGVSGGGLAVALAHLDTDARVLVVEQTRKSGAINRGDLIWPPHVELLQTWGVLPEMERRGAQMTAITAQTESGAAITIRRDGQEVAVQTAWLVGADGRNSTVRKAAGIDSPLTPYPYEILVTRVPKLPRWQDASGQFVGPRGWAGIFVIPGPYVRLALPFPAGSFAAFMQQPEAERTAEVVRRAGLLRDLPVDWAYVHNYKLFAHHAPAYQRGRVILLGDAAHAFTPMLGMGMNAGLEDAATLAPLLAYHGRQDRLDEPTLQREYDGRRRPRNQRILTESTRQGEAQIAGGALFRAGFRAALWVGARFPGFLNASLRSLFR